MQFHPSSKRDGQHEQLGHDEESRRDAEGCEVCHVGPIVLVVGVVPSTSMPTIGRWETSSSSRSRTHAMAWHFWGSSARLADERRHESSLSTDWQAEEEIAVGNLCRSRVHADEDAGRRWKVTDGTGNILASSPKILSQY